MIRAPKHEATDALHLRHAFGLAARGLGRTYPNPAVGCVIVAPQGLIVGRGWTQPGGRPHAETMALAQAGVLARGATAYVTLEPCAHQGQTGPCAQALIDAGVARVVCAVEDPDPRVSGRGLRMLRNAGIEVETGLLATEAARLNAGFFNRVQLGRPLVTLKIATSLDGKIALANGQSQWITGPEARAEGHRLRASHDVVLTGIGTIEADNPSLDCRLPGLEDRSPLRAVLDSRARLDLNAKIMKISASGPALVLTVSSASEERKRQLVSAGARVISCQADAGRVSLPSALKVLSELDITRVLVEGGATLTTSFLRSGLADRLVWFRAANVLGGDARDAISSLNLQNLGDALAFRRVAVTQLGNDLMESYERNA